jgi:hypothetical protein
VLRYDGTTGAFIDTFAAGGGLDQPAFLVFTPQAPPPQVPQAGTLTLLAVGLALSILLAARRRAQAARTLSPRERQSFVDPTGHQTQFVRLR